MLTINQLSIKKGGKALLKDISWKIPAGGMQVILGPSGSGKSTLLRSIAQLEKNYTGEVLFEEVSLKLLSAKNCSRYVCYISQDYTLFPHLSVLENCIQPQQIVRGRDRGAAEETAYQNLKQLGMIEYAARFSSELSGGQRQRAAIARALSMDASFLLLDEPTSALDPFNTSLLVDILQSVCLQGRGIVISTQDKSFAKQVMEKGIFIESGSLKEIFNTREEVLQNKNIINFLGS